MYYKTENEISTLVNTFIERTMDVQVWNHQAHLTVCIWFLKKYPKWEAICLMKSAIILYNNATNVPNNATRGYHETITHCWFEVIDYFINQHKFYNILETTNLFLHSPLSHKNVLNYFYDEKLYTDTKYRAKYMEPTISFEKQLPLLLQPFIK